MAEQIRYNQLYDSLTPAEQQEYAGYKTARNLTGVQTADSAATGTNFPDIYAAEQAAEATKPNMWNPMNWIFSPAESAMSTPEERAAIERGSADIEYNAPNYLGSRSPITYPSQRPGRLYGRGDTSGLTQNVGGYGQPKVFDPAFGELGQTDFWDTAYPDSHFKAKGYYDEYDDIPRLQRNDFYENFKDQGITGLDVQETMSPDEDTITAEGWRLPDTDFGPVRRTEALPPRGRLDRFLQRFGVPPMTQVTAADKLANKQFMGQQGIGRNPQTGRMYGDPRIEGSQDFAGKNAPGTSGWGSANFGEMAQKWDEEYGDMVYKTDKMKEKQARIKAQAAAYAQKVAADRQERIRNEKAAANAANQRTQRRPGMGGSHMSRSVGQGGLGISASQAQAVSDANRAAGMGGWNLAHGGRVGYNTGGRVGILAAF